MGLVTPEKGSVITYEGRDLTRLNRKEKREVCKEIQMVFQDPYGSLNPRMKVGEALLDVMHVHGLKRIEKIGSIMQKNFLKPWVYPKKF